MSLFVSTWKIMDRKYALKVNGSVNSVIYRSKKQNKTAKKQRNVGDDHMKFANVLFMFTSVESFDVHLIRLNHCSSHHYVVI